MSELQSGERNDRRSRVRRVLRASLPRWQIDGGYTTTKLRLFCLPYGLINKKNLFLQSFCHFFIPRFLSLFISMFPYTNFFLNNLHVLYKHANSMKKISDEYNEIKLLKFTEYMNY